MKKYKEIIMLPKEPTILLSVINTKLRDFHESLEDLCHVYDCHPQDIKNTLSQINYYYDQNANQFK